MSRLWWKQEVEEEQTGGGEAATGGVGGSGYGGTGRGEGTNVSSKRELLQKWLEQMLHNTERR